MKKLEGGQNMNLKKNANRNPNTPILDRCGRKLAVVKVPCLLRTHVHTATYSF
jgi:hypothetical protein